MILFTLIVSKTLTKQMKGLNMKKFLLAGVILVAFAGIGVATEKSIDNDVRLNCAESSEVVKVLADNNYTMVWSGDVPSAENSPTNKLELYQDNDGKWVLVLENVAAHVICNGGQGDGGALVETQGSDQ